MLAWTERREAIRWCGNHNSSNSEIRHRKGVRWMSFRPWPPYLKWNISGIQLIGSWLSVRSQYGRDAEDESSCLCRESNYSHPAHYLVSHYTEWDVLVQHYYCPKPQVPKLFGAGKWSCCDSNNNGKDTGRVGKIFLSIGLTRGKEMLGVS